MAKIPSLAYSEIRNMPPQPRQFGSNLAGLIEADGWIGVLEDDKNPMIEITLNKKDEPLAIKLGQILGVKAAIKYPSKQGCRLSIASRESVMRVISEINGKMRTPKYYALVRAIERLNDKGENIIVQPMDNSPIIENS